MIESLARSGELPELAYHLMHKFWHPTKPEVIGGMLLRQVHESLARSGEELACCLMHRIHTAQNLKYMDGGQVYESLARSGVVPAGELAYFNA